MSCYGAAALNNLIGRMIEVEFTDGRVETGLLSVPGPAYGSPQEGKWMLYTSLDGDGVIFRRSHVKAITVARTGRRVPKGWGRPRLKAKKAKEDGK